MKTFITLSFVAAISFLAGQQSIYLAYDPARFNPNTAMLAGNAFMKGCVVGGHYVSPTALMMGECSFNALFEMNDILRMLETKSESHN